MSARGLQGREKSRPRFSLAAWTMFIGCGTLGDGPKALLLSRG
jgi:hypothetical protein